MNKIFKEIHFLKDVLLPLLITISGIYIALLLNQWQNNQSDKNLKNIIQQQIKKEISENLKILIKTNNYHVNTQKQVLHYDSLGKDSVKQFFKVWKGLYPAFLKRTAFESANVSGVFKIFHYEDYHKISSVYTYQNQLEKVNDIYINNFFKLVFQFCRLPETI